MNMRELVIKKLEASISALAPDYRKQKMAEYLLMTDAELVDKLCSREWSDGYEEGRQAGYDGT